jgi:hypothetical protein
MYDFYRKSVNFILLMTISIVLLFIDLFFWSQGLPTFSETIWGVNQFTIALSFGVGIVCGHLFTVPK